MKKSLIIISCSSRKKKVKGSVKAWDLYDGVIYRVLKKNKIDFKKFDVRIISAKYGFLKPSDKINYYDQMMNKKQADELRNEITKQFKRLLKKYNTVYVCLGKVYLSAINIDLLKNRKIITIEGPIGIKMQEIKKMVI